MSLATHERLANYANIMQNLSNTSVWTVCLNEIEETTTRARQMVKTINEAFARLLPSVTSKDISAPEELLFDNIFASIKEYSPCIDDLLEAAGNMRKYSREAEKTFVAFNSCIQEYDEFVKEKNKIGSTKLFDSVLSNLAHQNRGPTKKKTHASSTSAIDIAELLDCDGIKQEEPEASTSNSTRKIVLATPLFERKPLEGSEEVKKELVCLSDEEEDQQPQCSTHDEYETIGQLFARQSEESGAGKMLRTGKHGYKRVKVSVDGFKVVDGDKRYACDYCDYRTDRRGHIQQHVQRHTGVKPLKCDYCDYRSVGNMMRHVKSHFGGMTPPRDFGLLSTETYVVDDRI